MSANLEEMIENWPSISPVLARAVEPVEN